MTCIDTTSSMRTARLLLLLLALRGVVTEATEPSTALDTCDGAVANLFNILGTACSSGTSSQPKSCGNQECASAISSINDAALSLMKTGFTACGNLPEDDGTKSRAVYATSLKYEWLLVFILLLIIVPIFLLLFLHGQSQTHGKPSGSSRQMRVERTPGSKRSTASCVTLAVLVFASLVGSTQAYSCTSVSDCQFEGCNDRQCSSTNFYCVNGKWSVFCSNPSLPYSCYYTNDGSSLSACPDPQRPPAQVSTAHHAVPARCLQLFVAIVAVLL